VRCETRKLLEANRGSKLLDTGLGDNFFNLTKSKSSKIKNKQMRLSHTKNSVLHSKGNHQQNEKAIY